MDLSHRLKTLRQLWALVLSENEGLIKDDDVFFDLGGDSLTATELVDAAEEQGLTFTIEDLFNNPSLESLAACKSLSRTEVPARSDPISPPQSRRASDSVDKADRGHEKQLNLQDQRSVVPQFLPLTPRQVQSIDWDSLSQSQKACTWRRAQLSVDVPVARIRKIFDDIVTVHPILRAQPDRQQRCLRLVDVGTMDVGAQYRSHTSLYTNLTQQQINEVEQAALGSIDLFEGPVFSVDLYRSNTGLCIFLVAHAVLLDETSWSIILQDLSNAISLGIAPAWPAQGLWQVFKHNLPPNNDMIAPRDKQLIKRNGSFAWPSRSRRQLDASISATIDGVGEPASKIPLDDWNGRPAAVVVHVFKSFASRFGPFLGIILPETRRVDGLERTVGNLGGTPITWNVSTAEADDNNAQGWIACEHQIAQALEAPFSGHYHGNIGSKPADLVIHLRSSEPKPGASRGAESVLNVELLNKSQRIAFEPRDYVHLDLSVLPRKIQTCHVLHSGRYEADAIQDWITDLWADGGAVLNDKRQADHPSAFVGEIDTNRRHYKGIIGTQGAASLSHNFKAISAHCNAVPDQIESTYPCSPMQESLVAEFDGSVNLYVRQFVFKVADDVFLERFQSAWETTALANPVLRTRFCQLAGKAGYMQAVIKQSLQWSSSQADLDQFLKLDASNPMVPGDPYFRYAIVAKADANGLVSRHFVWTVHHALCDGATIPMILAEVAQRYSGDNGPALARRPFESFILSPAITTDSLQERDYWVQALSQISPVPYPTLPHDSGFVANPSASLSHKLVIERHPPHGITKALLLRAAWAILLSHYTGTEDVCFGVINSGRTAAVPGITKMTGPTINLVPLGLHIDHAETVASLLARVRTNAAGMIRFEHSGPSKIRKFVASSQPTALDFQTILVVHPGYFSDVARPSMNTLGLQYVAEMGKREKHPYPMVISFTLSSGNWIDLDVQYDQRIVATQQVSNLAHHFQTILTQLSTANEDALVESISPFSDNDFTQISRWNRYTPTLEETCVDQLFSIQVSKQPNAIAVRSLEQSLTYSEVDTDSSSLAAQLLETGANPGNYVGVCFEKSIWTVIAILAVFKAGCVYVPIDPAYPQGRIREIVTTVGINVAIASSTGANALSGLCDRIIMINKSPRPPTSSLPTSRSHPHAIAYLLFTSGSTGKPKGILIPHAAICTSIKHHGRAFGANPQWRTLQFCAHTFDISIGEFLTTLAYGGCICVPSESDRLNNLAQAITALGANTLLVVPTVANLLQPKDVPTLETIVLGGEPVPQEIITRWAEHVNLICSYGPSECAVWSSANLAVSPQAHPAHIGRSIGGTMWVANPSDHSQLSAIGCVGELVISGPILGRGYFGDEATTKIAFLPAPAWLRRVDPTSLYDKIYKTGDLARYNPDGTFHIIGRLDTQVKLRGFRIELGEIENQIMATGTVTAALAMLPRVGPCANQIVTVLSHTKADLGNHSGGPIAVSAHGHFGLDDIKAHVRFTLPQYMVPSVWIVLERMPLLISGKIDRKSIKVWTDGLSQATYDGIMQRDDRSETEAISPGSLSDSLRSLWSEALSTPADRIGKQTSFFSLGGDSLAAMQIVSRAKKVGLTVTVRGILGTANLGDLADLTEKRSPAKRNSVQNGPADLAAGILDNYKEELERWLKGRSAIRIEDAYPLSPGQREILRARRTNPHVFLLSWHMKISPPETNSMTLDRIAKAWKRVVQKYPILRTIFLQGKGGLPALQVVLGSVEPDIAISSAGANEVMPSAITTGLKHVDDCFLPHRAHFIRHGDIYFGTIELNHMLIDGWSLQFIKQAFLDAYVSSGAPLVVQPPSYKSYIATLQPDRVQADERHWAAALRDQEPSLLSPSPRNFDKQPRTASSRTVINLQAIPARSLSSFSTDNGITLASIVDAAWAQTLGMYTKSSNVTFAYVNSGRDEDVPGVSEIVGPLINILTYHLHGVSTNGGPETLASLAQRMQRQRGEDSAHTSCSISEVVEDILHLGKLFNTGVNFQRRSTSLGAGSLRVDDLLDESKDPWHVSGR